MKHLLSVSLSATAVAALVFGLFASPVRAQERINAHAAHKGTFNYFRTEPNRHSHIIEKMRQGTPFVITGKSGEYYSIVLTDGRSGWTYEGNAAIDGQNAPAVNAEGEGEIVPPVAPVAPLVPGEVRQAPVVAPVVAPVSAPVAAPIVGPRGPALRGPEVIRVPMPQRAPAHRVVHIVHVRGTRAPRIVHSSRAPRVLHTPHAETVHI